MSEDRRLIVAADVSAVPAALAGAGQYTTSLIGSLVKRGDVALDLVARRSDAERWKAIAPSASIAAVAPDDKATRVVYGELGLGRAISRHFADARVFFGPHYTFPMRLDVPAVVTVHDLTLVDNPEWHEPLKSMYFRAAIRRVARRASAIVCVSERVAARLRERFDPQGSVFVVPHGIDHDRFTPNEPSAGFDAAALLRLGVREPFAVHVGTIEPRKNLPGLIAAFDVLADEHDELSLVLVGANAWGARAATEALNAARHRERIGTLGYLDAADVPALLRRAAVVAYPSFAEGFGLPALEALACGAPLVTSIDTVMADVADGAAVLVDPTDATSIADGIATVLSDGEAASRRREEGLAVASGYTWERSAAGHVSAFGAAGR